MAFAHRHPRRCRKIGGIGRVLEMKLADALNVRTCGDLIDNLPECYCVLGKSAAMGFLHEVALGCGECGGPTDDGDEDDDEPLQRQAEDARGGFAEVLRGRGRKRHRKGRQTPPKT